MDKLDQRNWSEFNRKFWTFGMMALGVIKSEYLLNEKNGIKFSKAQKEQIIREQNVSYHHMQGYFSELMALGIPAWMLSVHLQVDQPKK